MKRKQLEAFYLMNVVLYISTTERIKLFVMINKKCQEVVQNLKTNPYSSERNITKEIQLFEGIETIKTNQQELGLLKEKDINQIKLFDIQENTKHLSDKYHLNSSINNRIVKIHKQLKYKESLNIQGMKQLRTLKISMEHQIIENKKFWKHLQELPKLRNLIIEVDI